MIIHLSGVSAGAKSTIGRYIANRYPDVLVVDFDDFTLPLANKLYQNGQQRYYTAIVNDYINFVINVARRQGRKLLIVGYPDWRDYHPHVPSHHKLFIAAPMSVIVGRRATRDHYHSYDEIASATYALTNYYKRQGYHVVDQTLAVHYIEQLLS